MQKQLGYHESSPFRKSGDILDEMVQHISRITGVVKYSHSEVGFIKNIQSDVEEIQGKNAEQLEVEFLPRPVEGMADDLIKEESTKVVSLSGLVDMRKLMHQYLHIR